MIESGAEILLVEDSEDDIELALHAFQKMNLRDRICVARNGVEALNILFGEDSDGVPRMVPKVILLDLKLPKVNGLEVLRRIKSDPRTQATPVTILTSSREELDIAAAYELGVNSYIVKPVDFEQFSATLSTLGMYWLLLNQPPTPPSRQGHPDANAPEL